MDSAVWAAAEGTEAPLSEGFAVRGIHGQELLKEEAELYLEAIILCPFYVQRQQQQH